jgi:hypothetical protein
MNVHQSPDQFGKAYQERFKKRLPGLIPNLMLGSILPFSPFNPTNVLMREVAEGAGVSGYRQGYNLARKENLSMNKEVTDTTIQGTEMIQKAAISPLSVGTALLSVMFPFFAPFILPLNPIVPTVSLVSGRRAGYEAAKAGGNT